MNHDVETIRFYSRQVVREQGMLQSPWKNYDLSFAQIHVLLELSANKGARAQDLSEALCLDKSTISRMIKVLHKKNLVTMKKSKKDKREKVLTLTSESRELLRDVNQKANAHVEKALSLLSDEQRQGLVEGIKNYAIGLRKARLRDLYSIREIEARDDDEMAIIIHDVLAEFDATGPGFSVHDAEVLAMSKFYRRKGRKFFVISDGETIYGGGGIAELENGDPEYCELRKMYLLPEIRSVGLGQAVANQCLEFAKKAGYRYCYLETLERMHEAQTLYTKLGFKKLKKPIAGVGHAVCDGWHLLDLQKN